jgi:GNAT superfamily N-acetyltransferase
VTAGISHAKTPGFSRLKIREYRNTDLPVVLDLHQIAMQEIGVYIEGPLNDDLKDIENIYLRNKGTFIVGTLDDDIVTMGAFRRIDDKVAEIKRMRTYPEHQGKGYGSMILNELIARSKAYNYKEIILDTSVRQTAAIRLYTKNGFEEYKSGVRHGLHCIYFRLSL